ncbi:MAG TPA: hypothetical protein VGM60_09400 [Pseudonocardia sp.]|jgi:hypothetical protein|uniref:hypothetical protein n=1 Tax=Pseudonocardia sp. TaxID=60912 RepID=UPI002F42D92E
MRFTDPIPDGEHVVRSVVDGYFFLAPTVAAVDEEIATLVRDFLGSGSSATELRRAKARRDIDALLDRRAWLTLKVA